MKKFIQKIILFVVVLAVILVPIMGVFFTQIAPQYSEGYNASLLDKAERLKSIKEPKIVLIGNSNVSFGFQSELIEEAFDMPVVNMGLHGGLDNAFHENMAKLNVQEGDIYIICHHTFADDGKIDDVELAWITVENHTELWQLMNRQDITSMCMGLPSYMKKASVLWGLGLISKEAAKNYNAETDACYSRDAFNEYGDVAYPREEGTFVFKEQSLPEINDTCVNRLNELNSYLKKRGATMVVAGYPIGKGEFTPPEEDFVSFRQELQGRLDCQVISDYRDYFFDYDYFYNSFLHLTTEGAKLRTEQLIKDLEGYGLERQDK